MKLTVTAYKSTGKFYDSADIECSENIELFDDRFKELIRSAVPCLQDGFVVVTDKPDGEGFHNHLFFANELR